MTNHVITPSPEGVIGRIYLLQMGIKGRAASSGMVGTKMCTSRQPWVAYQVANARA
jgi:hypothetical protein